MDDHVCQSVLHTPGAPLEEIFLQAGETVSVSQEQDALLGCTLQTAQPYRRAPLPASTSQHSLMGRHRETPDLLLRVSVPPVGQERKGLSPVRMNQAQRTVGSSPKPEGASHLSGLSESPSAWLRALPCSVCVSCTLCLTTDPTIASHYKWFLHTC